MEISRMKLFYRNLVTFCSIVRHSRRRYRINKALKLQGTRILIMINCWVVLPIWTIRFWGSFANILSNNSIISKWEVALTIKLDRILWHREIPSSIPSTRQWVAIWFSQIRMIRTRFRRNRIVWTTLISPIITPLNIIKWIRRVAINPVNKPLGVVELLFRRQQILRARMFRLQIPLFR